jgi:hypothetical protein
MLVRGDGLARADCVGDVPLEVHPELRRFIGDPEVGVARDHRLCLDEIDPAVVQLAHRRPPVFRGGHLDDHRVA